MIFETLVQNFLISQKVLPSGSHQQACGYVYDRREPLRKTGQISRTCNLVLEFFIRTGSSNAAFAFMRNDSTNIFKKNTHVTGVTNEAERPSLAMRTWLKFEWLDAQQGGACGLKTIGKQLQIEKDLCHNFFWWWGSQPRGWDFPLQWRSWKHGLKPLQIQKGYMTLMIMFIKPSKIPTRKTEARAQDTRMVSPWYDPCKDYVLIIWTARYERTASVSLPEGMVYGDLRFIKTRLKYRG